MLMYELDVLSLFQTFIFGVNVDAFLKSNSMPSLFRKWQGGRVCFVCVHEWIVLYSPRGKFRFQTVATQHI